MLWREHPVLTLSLQHYERNNHQCFKRSSLQKAQDTITAAGYDGGAVQGFLQLGAEEEALAEENVIFMDAAALPASKQWGLGSFT